MTRLWPDTSTLGLGRQGKYDAAEALKEMP